MYEQSKFITTRKILVEECQWLDNNVPKGTVVVEVPDSYGCCTEDGIMVEYDGCGCPTEIPLSALQPYNSMLS